MPVSPVPLFLLATAALAAVALYFILKMLRSPLAAPRAVSLRQRRAEEQIRWDQLHPPTAQGGL